MTASGYTSGDPTKVDKTGDTMTGQLNMGASTAEKSFDLVISSGGRPAFFKTTSTYDHAVVAYLTGGQTPPPAGGGYNPTQHQNSALNVISESSDFSAMQLSGVESNRGTLKIAHKGYADGSDSSAAALSIDLQTDYNELGDTDQPGGLDGTAAQGIFVTSSTGKTLGNLLTLRNNGRDDFVVKGTGRVGIGLTTGATPAGALEVFANDDSTPSISVKAHSTGAANLLEFKRSSDGAVRTRVSPTCQIVSQEIAFFSGPGVQIGGSSLLAGGGSIVLGIANASTVPSTNPTGGGVLYCEGGALKFRGSSGDIFNTAKQTVTGSRGGNAALASLLTALANAGLITDSTS